MKIAVLDIGGTFLKYGMWEDGVLSNPSETPSDGKQGGDHIVSLVLSVLKQLAPFDAVGISTTGQVNVDTGAIKYANMNIPNYTGCPLGALVEAEFGVPVAVENDGNCAAIGEAYYGAAAFQEKKEFLCLTYGTGIGGAFFLDNKLYHGSNFSAGEIGHIITHGEKVVDGGSFFDGGYEAHASVTALVRNAKALDETLTSGRIIMENMARPEVKQLLDDWIGEILIGLSTLVLALNPSLVVVGGGIMSAPYVAAEVERRLPHYIMPSHLPVSLKPALLGNTAGMEGAAWVALQKLGGQ